MSAKHLLLVDLENVHKVDLSVLDESYRAIIFVGALQNPPRASRHPATAHRFTRVDFRKIEGSGKNALDFHIAFELGRIFELAPDTVCIVLSRDKGFDPLLAHLNRSGMQCRRVGGLDELATLKAAQAPPAEVACRRCGNTSTIEHHGGRWCVNCGRFASPPDPSLLPSNQPGYEAADDRRHRPAIGEAVLVCDWCGGRSDMIGGIFDDGEWMCGHCIEQHVGQ